MSAAPSLNFGQANKSQPQPPTPPPALPSGATEMQKVMDMLKAFQAPATQKWVPGPTKPLELIEVTSYAQLPVILQKIQNSPDLLRLEFPAIDTGDKAKDARIEQEQKEIRKLLEDLHGKPLGALVKDAFDKVKDSHIFDELTKEPAMFTNVLGWWTNNDIWNLNDKNAVPLQVQEVVNLAAGADAAEKTALRDLFVKGAAAPTTSDRFIAIIPAQETEAKGLVQEVLVEISKAAGTTPVDLTKTKVWLCANVVWDDKTLPANAPSAIELSLEELKKRLDAGEAILPKGAANPWRKGKFSRLMDWAGNL